MRTWAKTTALTAGFVALGATVLPSGAFADTTSGQSGVLSGNQLNLPVSAPIDISGNGIAGVGASKAHSKGGAKVKDGGHGGGQQTSGQSGVGSGNQVNSPVSAPVNVCGNAVAIIGTAVAGCEGGAKVSDGGHGGGQTTSGAAGVGSGNQANAPISAPVNVCGNAVAIIGAAQAMCEGTAVVHRPGHDHSYGHTRSRNLPTGDLVDLGTSGVPVVDAPGMLGGLPGLPTGLPVGQNQRAVQDGLPGAAGVPAGALAAVPSTPAAGLPVPGPRSRTIPAQGLGNVLPGEAGGVLPAQAGGVLPAQAGGLPGQAGGVLGAPSGVLGGLPGVSQLNNEVAAMVLPDAVNARPLAAQRQAQARNLSPAAVQRLLDQGVQSVPAPVDADVEAPEVGGVTNTLGSVSPVAAHGDLDGASGSSWAFGAAALLAMVSGALATVRRARPGR